MNWLTICFLQWQSGIKKNMDSLTQMIIKTIDENPELEKQVTDIEIPALPL